MQLDPLRKFYTSTLEQLPNSEMAKRWCVAADTAACAVCAVCCTFKYAFFCTGTTVRWPSIGVPCFHTFACFLKTLWLMAEGIARLLQHGLLPREEAEELVATLKGLKCAPIAERCGWVATQ